MRDRELLEWAAKAAGETLEFKEFGDILMPVRVVGGESQYYCWNPLRSNGQAMELATALRLSVCHHHNGDNPAVTAMVPVEWHGVFMEADEPHADDANAATRRAIVRAAASIGQQMEK